MYPLREDETRYTLYERQAGMPLREEDLDLKVLEWGSGTSLITPPPPPPPFFFFPY